MAYAEEIISELTATIGNKRTHMQSEFTRGRHGELFVLRFLTKEGSQSPSRIAEAMHVTSGRVSAVLDTLEKKGLISRSTNPQDRRSSIVTITDAGVAYAREHDSEMHDAMVWIFQQMGERRSREFASLLAEFVTYASICNPGGEHPSRERINEAFDQLAQEQQKFREEYDQTHHE